MNYYICIHTYTGTSDVQDQQTSSKTHNDDDGMCSCQTGVLTRRD